MANKILEYSGSIYQLKHWRQELLGYEFIIIHCSAAMIGNVDGISRNIKHLVYKYLITTLRLHNNTVS